MATPMIQAKYASSSGNWYIGFDYVVSASAFDITKLYGWRSNYESKGTLGMKITVNSGTANTSQSDTVTATFGKGAWSSTYWSFKGSNCNYATVTGITANTITVTIEITSTFNDNLPKGTKFVYKIAMPVSKPTMNAVTIKSISRTSVTISSSVSSNGGRTITASGFSVYLSGTLVKSLTSLSGTISGLTPNTAYSIQSYGTNSVGTGYSASNTFTTTGNAPTVTASVSNITRTSATISSSATYDTNASYSSHQIEWGYTTDYGSTTTGELTGLNPNATVYYKVSYTDNYNRTGTKTGSFMTLGDAPSITYDIVEVTATTVEIAFETQFDSGTEFSYGWLETDTKTIDITEPTGSIVLTDLTPESTYTYTLGMMDANGYQTTVEITFTTLSDGASIRVKTYIEGEGVVWKKGKVFYKQEGKNLFDDSVKESGWLSEIIGAEVFYNYSSVTYTYVNCAYLEGGKTYTISWEQNTAQVSNNDRAGGIVDENNILLERFITWKYNVTTITITPTNSGYMLLGVDINATKIQIEEGSTATEYEPYVEPWRVAKKIYLKDTNWKEG